MSSNKNENGRNSITEPVRTAPPDSDDGSESSDSTDREMYQRIGDTLTLLSQGGEAK